jgi:hypothetical protein
LTGISKIRFSPRNLDDDISQQRTLMMMEGCRNILMGNTHFFGGKNGLVAQNCRNIHAGRNYFYDTRNPVVINDSQNITIDEINARWRQRRW